MKVNTPPELKYYGIHSCRRLWESRPDDVIRVYIAQSNVKVFSPLLKWCAQQKKAYHIVSEEELSRVTESIHHEGICILAKDFAPLSKDSFLQALKGKNAPLLYLDGVENPHNMGSLIRTSAHFGVPFLIGEKGKLPALSPSAYRIAKGGAESIRLLFLEDPIKTLLSLKDKGFALIGTSSHKGSSLYASVLPAKSIFILGSESRGMNKEMSRIASLHVNIPGSGAVESLNVSVAGGLLLGEYRRQHPLMP